MYTVEEKTFKTKVRKKPYIFYCPCGNKVSTDTHESYYIASMPHRVVDREEYTTYKQCCSEPCAQKAGKDLEHTEQILMPLMKERARLNHLFNVLAEHYTSEEIIELIHKGDSNKERSKTITASLNIDY